MPKNDSRLSFITDGIAQQDETISKRAESVARTTSAGNTVRIIKTSKTVRIRRTHVTLNLPTPLLEQLRAAAYWVPGASMSGIVEHAAEAELARLAKQHNGGKPFQKP